MSIDEILQAIDALNDDEQIELFRRLFFALSEVVATHLDAKERLQAKEAIKRLIEEYIV